MRRLLAAFSSLLVAQLPLVNAAELEPSGPAAATLTARSVPPASPGGDHPTPKLKLSYVRFSAGNPNGGAVPLQALQLDMYTLSWRWLRAGVDAEAGRGHATLSGTATSLQYGLLGVNAGLQFPGRLTPFIEGRLAGGVLAGTVDGTLALPGTGVSLTGVAAATWLYARGLDAGVEIYTVGRAYVSTSLGWVRTTWRGANYVALGNVQFRDVTHDSFLLKMGLGI